MNTRKVLIDTDPGVDDAMAIFMALASPRPPVDVAIGVDAGCVADLVEARLS